MARTHVISKEKRADLLRQIRSYNPRFTEKSLDLLIQLQGVEAVEFAVRGAHGGTTSKAIKSRSPLAGLNVGYKDADVGAKIDAMIATLELPTALVTAMSRQLSEQQQYDLLKLAIEDSGKHVSFNVEIKSQKSRRSPLAGMFKENG